MESRGKENLSQKQRHHTRGSSRGRRTAWVPRAFSQTSGKGSQSRLEIDGDRTALVVQGRGQRSTPGPGGSLVAELDPAVTTLSSRCT